MERKDGIKNEETMRIRMSADLLKRIQNAKVPSGWGEEADSSFSRHLLILGIEEAEYSINEKKARNEARIKRALESKLSETSLVDTKKAGNVNVPLITNDPEPEYVQEIGVQRPSGFDNNVVSISYDIVYVPFYGKSAAGKPIDFDIPVDRVVPWPREKIKGDSGRYFTVQIKGTSMTEAGIIDGDYVLMRYAEAPRQNHIMLVRHENESTVKRIKMKGDQEVYMCWEDGSGQKVRLDLTDYQIQGEFVSIMRG